MGEYISFRKNTSKKRGELRRQGRLNYTDMKAEDYKTEITFEELKGHYKTHFLTAEQFMDLVKKWHKNLLIQENLDLKKQNTELAEILKKSVRIIKQMDDGVTGISTDLDKLRF